MVFSTLLCISLCLDEPFVTVLASPHAMLVYMLILWMRFEWCVQQRKDMEKRIHRGVVKENYELSQTVMNLSEQHRLLCEIRNTVLKSLRYSKDTYIEVKYPSATNCSMGASLRSNHSSGSTPESNAPETCKLVSPLSVEGDWVHKSKAAFRCNSMSESSYFESYQTRVVKPSFDREHKYQES